MLKRLLSPLSAALAAAVLLLAGCASTAGYARPEVSLVGVRLADVSLFETTAVFTVRLINPGQRSLVVDGGVFDFYLNGARVGTGTSTTRLEVPGLQTGTQEVTVYIRNAAVGRRLKSLFRTGSLDYRLAAQVFVPTALGQRKIATESKGKVDIL